MSESNSPKDELSAGCVGGALLFLVVVILLGIVSLGGRDANNQRGGFEPKLIDWKARADELAKTLRELAPTDLEGFQRVRKETWVAELEDSVRSRVRDAERDWGQRAVAHLEKQVKSSPPGTVDEYAKIHKHQEQLVAWFPEMTTDLKKTVADWKKTTAEQVAAQLKATSPGDLDGYERVSPDWILREFGVAALPVDTANTEWGAQTASLLQKSIEKLDLSDRAKLKDLQQQRVRFCKHFPDPGKEVRTTEWTWANRNVTALGKSLRPRLTADPAEALKQLRAGLEELEACDFPELAGQPQAKELVGEIVRAALDQARTRAREHHRAQRYQAAHAVSVQLIETFGPAAQQVNMMNQLQAFRQSCEVLAQFAQRAGKTDPQ